MKIRVLFLFLVLTQSKVIAGGPQPLRLTGSVPFRTERLLQFDGSTWTVDPSQEPSLKVEVIPFKTRGPASNSEGRKKISEREVLKESSRIIVEAP